MCIHRRLVANHKADWPQVIWDGLDMAHAQKATDAAPSSEAPAGTAVALVHFTDAVADAVNLLQKKPADASDHDTTAALLASAPTERTSPTAFFLDS